MIDWAGLVLAPAMALFARPILFTPAASQPGAAPYTARGVYAVKQVSVKLESGDVFTDQQPTLGIRVADFAAEPMQGDTFVMDGKPWQVWDVQPDGQGGADLVLKQDV